jgi:hypothetical protein
MMGLNKCGDMPYYIFAKPDEINWLSDCRWLNKITLPTDESDLRINYKDINNGIEVNMIVVVEILDIYDPEVITEYNLKWETCMYGAIIHSNLEFINQFYDKIDPKKIARMACNHANYDVLQLLVEKGHVFPDNIFEEIYHITIDLIKWFHDSGYNPIFSDIVIDKICRNAELILWLNDNGITINLSNDHKSELVNDITFRPSKELIYRLLELYPDLIKYNINDWNNHFPDIELLHNMGFRLSKSNIKYHLFPMGMKFYHFITENGYEIPWGEENFNFRDCDCEFIEYLFSINHEIKYDIGLFIRRDRLDIIKVIYQHDKKQFDGINLVEHVDYSENPNQFLDFFYDAGLELKLDIKTINNIAYDGTVNIFKWLEQHPDIPFECDQETFDNACHSGCIEILDFLHNNNVSFLFSGKAIIYASKKSNTDVINWMIKHSEYLFNPPSDIIDSICHTHKDINLVLHFYLDYYGIDDFEYSDKALENAFEKNNISIVKWFVDHPELEMKISDYYLDSCNKKVLVELIRSRQTIDATDF